MAAQVTEKEAREVAEAARETDWKLPSFGKELFLGKLRLDLIHPQPKLDAKSVEQGEKFLKILSDFLQAEVDPLVIEREARIRATYRPTPWSESGKFVFEQALAAGREPART